MKGTFSGKMVTGATLTLLVLSMLTQPLNVKPVKSSSTTIIVPDDYSTIQAALESASSGDTVYVKAGTYRENLAVNKTLSLVGEDPQNTIIDGSGLGNVLSVGADGVNLTGFTIRNSSAYQYAAITLNNASHCSISGNNITNNNQGIYLSQSDDNSIVGNNMTANNADGLLLYYSSENSIADNYVAHNDNAIFLASSSNNNSVTENKITNNHFGVYIVSGSNDNRIAGNNITSNIDNGVYIASNSSKNSVIGNDITNNTYGVAFASQSSSNNVTGNNITNNKYGVIGYSLSHNNAVVGNNITNNQEGIDFSSSYNNTIAGNNIVSTDSSILLGSSSNNSIEDNNATAIYGDGLQLYQSNNNSIVRNNMTANNDNGIYIESSSGNSVAGNKIMNSQYGVKLDGSFDNVFFHNSFIGNTQQVNSSVSTNVWDDGNEGNYWSDYTAKYPNATEIGDSGVWDTSYAIDTSNADHHPLINQPTVPEFPSPLVLFVCTLACLAMIMVSNRKRLQPVRYAFQTSSYSHTTSARYSQGISGRDTLSPRLT